jgi:putative oxygen-independent coproporphyrinogen III oxidase
VTALAPGVGPPYLEAMTASPALAPQQTAPTAAGLGVYVHWPFCVSKCPYCDFNSHVRARIDEQGWRAALLSELTFFAQQVADRIVTSIFFGGGTPSLMAADTARAVIDHVAQHWHLAADAEITLEANPNSAERARFADFRSAGINRVSLGVQALDDAALKMLGRAHDQQEARAAIAAAQVFPRYSFDLIYARPGQSVAAWQAELTEALKLAGGHLSVYQLTIEPGTAFHALHARGALKTPDEAAGEALYDATQELLEKAGLPAYEISNHARPGAESRHNLVYWRYEDYVGVGPGAHGRLTADGAKTATRQEKVPETWVAKVRALGHGTAERLPIGADEAATEALLMGLRLSEGIDAARFQRETGRALDDVVDRARLRRLIDGGFIAPTGSGLRVTGAGRKVLNAVLGALLA